LTGWDHEFAVPFINEGHFRVTDPGPLRAPVLDFSLRRDEALDLILETRTAPGAKSTAPEHPSGHVRITTECASLENIGGAKSQAHGVYPIESEPRSTTRQAGMNTLKKQRYMHLKPRCKAALRDATRLTGLKTCQTVHSSGRISSRQRLKPPRLASSALAMTASRFSARTRGSRRVGPPQKSSSRGRRLCLRAAPQR